MESGKGTRSLENKQLKDSLRLELETLGCDLILSPCYCCVHGAATSDRSFLERSPFVFDFVVGAGRA